MWGHILSTWHSTDVQVLLQVESLEAEMGGEGDRLLVVHNNVSVLAHAVHLDGVPLAHGQRVLGLDQDRLLAQVHAELNEALVQGQSNKVSTATALSIVQEDTVWALGLEGDLKVELVKHILHLREAHVAVGRLREVGNGSGDHKDRGNVHRSSVVGGTADVSSGITGLDLDQAEFGLQRRRKRV